MAHALIEDRAVDRYMTDVSRYPLLSREQETALALRYQHHGDIDAARRLVVANLRFVMKVAHEFRGYNLPLADLVQEGNIGLLLAVRKFDPTRGFRFISYAVWWVRAQIYAYVTRSWSLVNLGTGRVRRKLFFKLRAARAVADREARAGGLTAVQLLAKRFAVSAASIVDMENQLSARDSSLDAQIGEDAGETQLDRLRSPDASQEERLAAVEERLQVRGAVSGAMGALNDKERYIVVHRLMTEEPETLQGIGSWLQISRERARQIEANVVRKIGVAVLAKTCPLRKTPSALAAGPPG
ncbi:MAG: RNA polymerase factor sigma-32 [Deltaproteobacteria bacterium]|nr:RNA polymerase factor sigma-32 [Deltaproteobacteria bacterium]